VLVDSPVLSWNAGKKMSSEVREVWHKYRLHPSEYTEEYWERQEEFKSGIIQIEEEQIEFWKEQIEKFAKDHEEQRKRYEQYIADSQKRIEEYEQGLLMLKDRPLAIAEEAEKRGPEAIFIRPDQLPRLTEEDQKKYPEFMQRVKSLQNDPAFKNKAFILMAVGQKLMPHPSQSYPQPEQFEEWPWLPFLREQGKEKDSHRWSDPFTAGTTLRHEVFHYQGVDKESVEEYETDTKMFESIEKAWEKYQETGDTSGYPFIFETEEGMTFTKKREARSASAQSV